MEKCLQTAVQRLLFTDDPLFQPEMYVKGQDRSKAVLNKGYTRVRREPKG